MAEIPTPVVVDGAVEEEHAARQKPRTNAVKSRIMIVPFCDRNEDLESIFGLALTPKVDILHLRRAVANVPHRPFMR